MFHSQACQIVADYSCLLCADNYYLDSCNVVIYFNSMNFHGSLENNDTKMLLIVTLLYMGKAMICPLRAEGLLTQLHVDSRFCETEPS